MCFQCTCKRQSEGIYLIACSQLLFEIITDIGGMVRIVRENTSIPCAVGFGISTPEQAQTMASLSDGAIVGSAIVKMIAAHGKDSPEPVREYVREMAGAVHQL